MRKGREGRAWEGKGGDGRGRGLPSIPLVPNFPLHYWN